jgi:hypothetical protein
MEDSVKIEVTNPYTKKKLMFHHKQLPILPAFAMTDYKLQGKTLSHVIVDLESCKTPQSAMS